MPCRANLRPNAARLQKRQHVPQHAAIRPGAAPPLPPGLPADAELAPGASHAEDHEAGGHGHLHFRVRARTVEELARGGIKASVTIPHGVNPRFRAAQAKDLPRPAWLPAENYLLYVSTLDYYKAQVEVIQAYALLKERRPTTEKLVLAGPENPGYAAKVRREIARLNLAGDVIVPGKVAYGDLPALYHHALINIFASRTENCPNTLLEALAGARPILCSSRSAMPEFGADAPLYFDPSNPQELTAQLLRVIDNPPLQRQLSARAKERAACYDWARTCRLTWQAIENLHSGELDGRGLQGDKLPPKAANDFATTPS